MLTSDEPPPFQVVDRGLSAPLLLVCDHASNRVPEACNGLGLSPRELRTHFAVDIGAQALAEDLADRLGATLISANYSRLVVDCNRRLDHPTAFPTSMGSVPIPGNRHLGHAQRQRRADAIYWPYHHAVRDQLRALEARVPAPALIAIHSFTPSLHDQQRPWHVGVLWDKDPRIPEPLIAGLRRQAGLVVGDNEPYSGKGAFDFTIDHHGEAEGLPHVSIEVRQDLVADQEGVRQWSAALATALTPVLDNEALYTHWTS